MDGNPSMRGGGRHVIQLSQQCEQVRFSSLAKQRACTGLLRGDIRVAARDEQPLHIIHRADEGHPVLRQPRVYGT